MRFRLREDVETSPAGSLVYVPRGVPHTSADAGTTPARMLVLFSPSGIERFFDRFAAQDGTPAMEAFERALEGTGMEFLRAKLAKSQPR